MDIYARLAGWLLQTHPAAAADVLNGCKTDALVALFDAMEPTEEARVLTHLTPHVAACALAAQPDERIQSRG